MDELRMNPNDVLRRITEVESAKPTGQLKIFFGYAAGVGKTYAMLKEAHELKNKGVDVVIGYVEPHQRVETQALVEGLEQIPTQAIDYRGLILNEFDLDSAILRKPALVLVDELAHSNAEGCRHAKRYQDIEELLRAGINVYTTINVQHIESLNDMVQSITGIVVRERIPDDVFDNASQVKLVDIEPNELLERLNNGKIYKKAQAQSAQLNFFDIKNLTALREIALRRCADRINRISEKVRQLENNEYYTEEHILVCLSSSPTNPKIIRTASRMASAFRGKFTGLFVETSDFQSLSDDIRKQLRANIHLAQQLGATIELVYGDDVPLQIAEFARVSGVSKIVLGRSSVKRKYYWSKPTLSERLTENAPNLDIYIIPEKGVPYYKTKKKQFEKVSFDIADVFKSIALLVITTIIGTIFYQLHFSEANIITIYILSVLLTSIVTKQRIYSLISAFVSVLTFNYFFTEPIFTFSAYDSGYPATFLIMFIAAFITSTLAVKLKQHARQSSQTAYRTKILLETNQLLQKAIKKEEIVSVTANQLVKLFDKDIVIYMVDKDELQPPQIFKSGLGSTSALVTENEKAVAAWVYKNNKHAGASTNTLGSAACLYLAIRANDNVYGVIGIALNNQALESFENNILLSILGECGLALESQRAIKEREDAAVLAKNEQLRANLLRAISHDLRTPLTSISGSANILLASEDAMDSETKKKLYTDIYDDSLWLINLVENLLSVTRIEDGTMNLKCTSELIDEVITEAMNHVNRNKGHHKITVHHPDEFIFVKMDARLIIQVIINIVDNAIKYTPDGSEIVVDVKKKDNVILEISDNGPGIPDDAKAKIFDMFFTGTSKIVDSRRSMGLGLALCKSIITAHGGEISVHDNKPQGTIFRCTLPLEEVVVHE
ncbi:sensor histidine kinase KdpD [Anaerorhabdus sp.]|uniref:sensor histidine kinase KdpD n=1 Tax=Anaerorhabdus sp. TaxID=1872524 RepID=UPI002FC7BCC7